MPYKYRKDQNAAQKRYADKHKRPTEQKTEQNRKWRAANPEKLRAHRKVSNAVLRGRLAKSDRCQLCWEVKPRIEAHHEDYSKVLEVVWLCYGCHRWISGLSCKEGLKVVAEASSLNRPTAPL